MLTSELLSYIVDIGEQMLICGAEVSRVEDSISRMCKAYQAKRVDAFTITSSIMVSVRMTNDEAFALTRRIDEYHTNLNKLDQLNNLSRYLCECTPDVPYIRSQLESISQDQPYAPRIEYLMYAMIAGVFTIFFGGDLVDAVVSALIGILLKLCTTGMERIDKNLVLVNTLSSFAVGMLAAVAIRSGVGHHYGKIVIGNVMLLTPGLTLTNSIRDIINGDTISGFLQLSEAIVVALSVAVGFGIVAALWGGVLA